MAKWQAHHPAFPAHVHLLPGDHDESTARIARIVQGLRRPVCGLIYADPNGTALPVEVVRKLAGLPQLRRMDCLAYLSATNYKRRRRRGQSDGFLLDDLRAVGKDHIWVRKPMGSHQWTFGIATNWAGFPPFTRDGFCRAESVEVEQVTGRVNLRADERAAQLWQPLFEDPSPLLGGRRRRSRADGVRIARRGANGQGGNRQLALVCPGLGAAAGAET